MRILWPRHLPSIMRRDEAPCYDRGLALRCVVVHAVKAQRRGVRTERAAQIGLAAIRELSSMRQP